MAAGAGQLTEATAQLAWLGQVPLHGRLGDPMEKDRSARQTERSEESVQEVLQPDFRELGIVNCLSLAHHVVAVSCAPG